MEKFMYRDKLIETYGHDIGSVVGCGLDRAERDFTSVDIEQAVQYYEKVKSKLKLEAIGYRRQVICNLMQ